MLKVTANVIESYEPAKNHHIPDGVYDGHWGAYEVRFEVAGKKYRAQTSDGIRTQNARCKVTVNDGDITVECE